MKSLIAEWIWRAALIVALGWIGLELRQIHQDLQAPIDEQGTETVGPGCSDERTDDRIALTPS